MLTFQSILVLLSRTLARDSSTLLSDLRFSSYFLLGVRFRGKIWVAIEGGLFEDENRVPYAMLVAAVLFSWNASGRGAPRARGGDWPCPTRAKVCKHWLVRTLWAWQVLPIRRILSLCDMRPRWREECGFLADGQTCCAIKTTRRSAYTVRSLERSRCTVVFTEGRDPCLEDKENCVQNMWDRGIRHVDS